MIRFFKGDIFSECGSPIKEVYSPVVNDDGSISLQKSGEENLQEYIDSFALECDINTLISRFVNGDISALNQVNGSYGDFTSFPKTYAEMLQLQINSKAYFDKLPLELKEKFNNDPNQFFASAGSDDWFEKMSAAESYKSDKVVAENPDILNPVIDKEVKS